MKRIAITAALIAATSFAAAPTADANPHRLTTLTRIHRLEARMLRMEQKLIDTQAMLDARINQLRDVESCIGAIDIRIPDHNAQGADNPDAGHLFAAFDLPSIQGPTYYFATLHTTSISGQPCMTNDPRSAEPNPTFQHSISLQ